MPKIVKIQTPLATSEPEPLAMIYNQDRSIHEMVPIDEIIKRLMKNRPKAFFYHGPIDANGKLQILEEAPWQNW